MKAVRILLGVLIALVVLIVVVFALALAPAVQTWAVHKAVANVPGMKIDIGHVSAGFSAADLRDVHLTKNGLVVSANTVTARYSAMDYVLHKRLTVADLTVDGLVIDTREAAASAAKHSNAAEGVRALRNKPAESEQQATQPQTHEPFSGVLNGITLPVDLNVAQFAVPGRALLPGDQTATFDLRGKNLVTGQRGTVDWKAELTNSKPDAPYQAAHTEGTAAIHVTADRHIDAIDVTGSAKADGPKLPAQTLKIAAKAETQSGGNETYHASIDLAQGSTSEPLLTLNGDYAAAQKQIAGDWKLAVKSENVAALLTGLGLPDIVAEGSGKFTAHPDTGAANATGHLESTLSHPEKISPDLASIGSLHATIDFAGGIENNVASLDRLTIDATAADHRQLAQIQTLQRVGYALADKRITFADAKSPLARIAVTGLPLAWAQPFAKPLQIDSGEANMTLTVAAEPDGSQVHVTATEPLTLRNVTVRNGNQTLADRLNLSVKPQAVYAPDHLQAELADLDMTVATGDTVTGRFTADVTQLSKEPQIAFTTDTQAKFVALLKPYLNVETGPLTVVTKSDGNIAGNVMHFEHSSTRITRDNGETLATIELPQPITLDVQSKAVTTSKPDAETLRITFGQVPLNWAQSFVAGSKFDGQLAGGVIGITVRSLNDIAATTTTPIGLRNVSVAMNGQPMLRGVDLAADFSGAKHGDNVTFDVRKVEGRQGNAVLLSLSASGDMALAAKPTINAKGKLTADLTALMQQPAYTSGPTLARGNLDASFDAKIGENIQANAQITARNLVAKEGNRALGDANLNLTATVQPDGSSVLKIPFTLTNGTRKSDLLVDGKLVRSEHTVTFDGGITSNQLIVDDLEPLAALAPSSKTNEVERPVPGRSVASQPTNGSSRTSSSDGRANPLGEPRLGGTPRPTFPGQPAGTAGSTTSARDTQPFWTGFGGHVSLDLKRIDYGQNYSITGIRGNAVIDPKQLSIPSLEGNFKGNPFKVAATVTFNDAQPKPYTLNATTDVNNFDVGAFLKASNPNQPPQLETSVSINAKLNSTGATAADLGKDAYGTFDMNGSPGVVRGLGGKVGNLTKGGAAVLGLVGAAQGSDTTSAIAQVVNELTEFKFDKLSIHAERGADLNVKVPRIEFDSPDTRILGSGGIQNQPGVPIEKQPLQFTFQLGAKGHMAVLLNRIHMIGQQQDDQGYYLMTKQFTVKGSVENHQSDLGQILAEIGMKALPDVLPGVLKLFGK